MPSRNAKNRRSRKQKAGTQPNKAKLLSKNNVLSRARGNKCCISPVATRYLELLHDAASGPLMGIPDGSHVSTRKVRVWARGSVVAASSGVLDLSVVFNPIGMITSNQYCLSVATPAVAGTIHTPGGSQLLAASSNAPYQNVDFPSTADNVNARVVSAKMRMRYIGTELNKGGAITGLQEPNHSPLIGKTASQLVLYQNSKRVSVGPMKNGEWFELDYLPSDVNDTYFVNKITYSTPYDGTYISDGQTVATDQGAFIAAYIYNAAASTAWEYEAWAVVEYAGRNVTPKTVNIPDANGYALVIAAVGAVEEHNSRNIGSGSTTTKSYASQIYEAANSMVQGTLPQIKDMAYSAVSRYGPSIAAAAAQAILPRTRPQSRITYAYHDPAVMDLD